MSNRLHWRDGIERLFDRIDHMRRAIVVIIHLLLVAFANYAALWLRFDGAIPSDNWSPWLKALPWVIAIRALIFVPFRLYEGLWRYTSIWDLRNIVFAVTLSSTVAYVFTHGIWQVSGYPRSVYIIDGLLLVTLLGGVRLGRRIYREIVPVAERNKRVIIYGAGNAGEMIVRDLRLNADYDADAIGFLDDNPHKVGQRIHGVPVLGTGRDAIEIIKARDATEVLIAIPSARPESIRRIVRALEASNVHITTLPPLRYLVGGAPSVNQIRALQVEDLLARPAIGLSSKPLSEFVLGKRVLVTGAGGSIGSEICKQLASFHPAHLMALDRYENSLFAVLNEICSRFPDVSVHGAIGDVTDGPRMRAVFSECLPDVVFHAAAHKHVPLMEANPCEAVKNNVRGSRMVALLAREFGVSRFVLISTDKAVNPTSVMGATKHIAELTQREIATTCETRFVTVRFGNVLASNGSVVPTFLDQIQKGGPVTVTHPEMRRFFMLIPEAVQLVLHAAALNEHGHTYVLDMGEQIRLVDMARDLIRLSGYVPDKDIVISFIGLRPGEKLFEELVGDDELSEPSPIDKILRVRTRAPAATAGDFLDRVQELERRAEIGDRAGVIEHLRMLVPTFASPETTVGV